MPLEIGPFVRFGRDLLRELYQTTDSPKCADLRNEEGHPPTLEWPHVDGGAS